LPDKLFLATNNRGKARELKILLRELPLKLILPGELGISAGVEETGSSFEENASLKATALAKESGLLALADDSGLEVEALGGEPGVLSARYAGEGASDKERVEYLLKKLEGVPEEKRQARFRCVIAIAEPEGEVKLCSGECHGLITSEPEGERGFGYDPVFYFAELGKTMAELPLEVKNKVSHRGAAAREAVKYLRRKYNL
jgi:XTP/dITP diphosphohydrolase